MTLLESTYAMADMAPVSPITRILTSMDPNVRRELPMPATTKAGSIEQVQATLYLCSIKLRNRVDSWTEPNGFSQSAMEGQQFRTWLESWETAFSALLANAMPSMKQEDVDRCRVIKANHLSCVVLATVLESGPTARREALERDCLAIVGLAGAVLDGPASQQPKSVKTVMTMAEPLVIVQQHSSSDALRTHASQIMARHFSRADIRTATASISPASSVAASSPRSVLSHTFEHSRTSSQSRFTG